MRHLILVVVLIGSMPTASLAGTFSATLPTLLGAFDPDPQGSEVDASFDFGIQFAAIESVRIEIEADVTAFEYNDCRGIPAPTPPCPRVVGLPELSAILDEEDLSFPGFIFTMREISFSDDPQATEASGTGVGVFIFNENLNPFGWEVLMDGQGTVAVLWNILFPTVSSPSFQNVIPGTLEITSARMIIEGTPVPEPNTAVLTGLGLAAVASWTRTKRWLNR